MRKITNLSLIFYLLPRVQCHKEEGSRFFFWGFLVWEVCPYKEVGSRFVWAVLLLSSGDEHSKIIPKNTFSLRTLQFFFMEKKLLTVLTCDIQVHPTSLPSRQKPLVTGHGCSPLILTISFFKRHDRLYKQERQFFPSSLANRQVFLHPAKIIAKMDGGKSNRYFVEPFLFSVPGEQGPAHGIF